MSSQFKQHNGRLRNVNSPQMYLHNVNSPQIYLHNVNSPHMYLHNVNSPQMYLRNVNSPQMYLHNVNDTLYTTMSSQCWQGVHYNINSTKCTVTILTIHKGASTM